MPAAAAAPKILVHGHRGARALRPENTLPAFEYAIARGVDAIELDLAVTKDSVIVVSHDPYLHPPICSGPRPGAKIRELTLAEVRQWDCGKIQNPNFPKQTPIPGTHMPTLDEVLALASGNPVQFDLEIKSSPDRPELAPPPGEFARLVLDLVREHRIENRVVLQSFDFRVLHAMRELAPEIRRAALWEGADRDLVAIAREADAHIVSPEFHPVTPEKVQDAHAAGLQVVPWTANRPADWDQLIAARVDGIITDDPAALIAYLK
ncbi:MAG: glycerophosphodiester phosphodiesterase [Bryobacteraceae bacterium]